MKPTAIFLDQKRLKNQTFRVTRSLKGEYTSVLHDFLPHDRDLK